MTTPNDIIQLALKDSGVVGVGQAASAEDTNDAFVTCNMMLAQWQRKRWLIWHLADAAKVSTGAQSYTVGAGGDFDIARPDRLEAAFLRQITGAGLQIDYPLELLQSREDYNRIALKQLSSFPNSVFYDAAYPLGKVYFWPVPLPALYELHITVKETLAQFTSEAQSISTVPPEYLAAIRYNLAARLRPMYQMPPDPTITALALESLNVIRNANAQVPRLTMPSDLARGGRYNPYSDQIR